MSNLRPVILSGGAGKRLWPLSTSDRPKQFVPLFGGQSLFDITLQRISRIKDASDPWVVTGAQHIHLIHEASSKLTVETTAIVEPQGRNTAPAAIATALLAEPSDVLVILPADHVIADEEAFGVEVANASELAREGHIVALGVIPTRPEIGYGYIETGNRLGKGLHIESFAEKPSLEMAEQFIAAGSYLWNAGMFVTMAGVLLTEANAHRPGLVDAVRQSIPQPNGGDVVLNAEFSEAEAISIDNAIMEKTSLGAVIPLDAGWNDVGSYASLLEVLADESGNFLSGDVSVEGVSDTLVHASSRRVVVAGVQNVAVVETPDEVLVVALDESQAVKDLADER